MQGEIINLGPDVLGDQLYQGFLEFKNNHQCKNQARLADLAVFLASFESDRPTDYNDAPNNYAKLVLRHKL